MEVESRKPTKEELIRWIHSVEYKKPIRMAGLITELYFSTRLKSEANLKRYIDTTEGWFYIYHNTGEEQRCWLRIEKSNDVLNSTEVSFIRKLSSIGHKFFKITASLKTMANSAHPFTFPQIDLVVTEWTSCQETIENIVSDEARAVKQLLTQSLSSYMAGVSFDPSYGWNTSLPFKEWWETPDEVYLHELLIQRCLMNARPSNPLDLDAMAINHESGKLTFFEFKRKYPATGSAKPDHVAIEASDLVNIGYEIQDSSLAAELKTNEEAMDFFIHQHEKKNLKYVRQKCFGIDLCHYETLKLCNDVDIEYLYIIWNSGCREDERNLPDIIRALRGLIRPDMTPPREPNIWFRKLKPKDVDGLTFTFGDDSGSFTDGFRIQVVFDMHKKRSR